MGLAMGVDSATVCALTSPYLLHAGIQMTIDE